VLTSRPQPARHVEPLQRCKESQVIASRAVGGCPDSPCLVADAHSGRSIEVKASALVSRTDDARRPAPPASGESRLVVTISLAAGRLSGEVQCALGRRGAIDSC
jgi:hypothetical protein